LFGIGLFFVASLDNKRDESRLSDPVEIGDLPTARSSWIRLEFTVNEDGEAQDVEVVERCIRTDEGRQCVPDDDSLDSSAIETVLARQYSIRGKRQDIVILPPAGK
ncbi:MAG: hypothetical protein HUJ31_15575, partial [Pseudomonadales bacterium]|nr:hypothetical protein [Pseudomonadales bacterium]